MTVRFFSVFLVVALLLSAVPALAVNLSITYRNTTPFELMSVRAELKTEHESRNDSSRICLASGQDYRIGVSGAIEPMRIRLSFADGEWEFADLSGLNMTADMTLIVSYAGEVFRLEQENPDGTRRVLTGVPVWQMTDANRANAVAKEKLLGAKSLNDVRSLVKEAVEAGGGGQQPEAFPVEAGPLWNNAHATEHCPEVLREWNAARPAGTPEARWTGDWTTTVPGTMSVCTFMKGGAGLEGTLFEERGGAMLHFPIVWAGLSGSGSAALMGGDSGDLAVILRLNLEGNALETIFKDLAKSGYRPWRVDLEKRIIGEGEELNYAKAGQNAEQSWAEALKKLEAARAAGSLRDFTCPLVTEATFQELAAGKEVTPAPGALLRCGPGTLEVIFISDGSLLAR